ncbi:putative hemolysin [Aquirhabdus parva]|uniref:DUF333 domain-containing protein n=1 Tax=Aquirhabdus parva TaxID=2283318 RepID=A0A345PA13_9GAMM|nr:DUF333 domain-containing protein [Aquirhabdus parva]
MKKLMILSLYTLGVVDLAGCSNLMSHPDQAVEAVNPASVYCAKLGGKSVINNSFESRGADCILPSVERLNEWTMFSRNHKSI